MVFRFYKVARACARPENGKQTQVRHPLFLLNSNVGWWFGLSQNYTTHSHFRISSIFALFPWTPRKQSFHSERGVTCAAKVLTWFAVKAQHVWAVSDWWGSLLKVVCGSVNAVIILCALTSHTALVCGFSSTQNNDYSTAFYSCQSYNYCGLKADRGWSRDTNAVLL